MLRKLLTYFNLVKEPVWEIVDLFKHGKSIHHRDNYKYTFHKGIEVALYPHSKLFVVRFGPPEDFGTPVKFYKVERFILNNLYKRLDKNLQKQEAETAKLKEEYSRYKLTKALKGE